MECKQYLLLGQFYSKEHANDNLPDLRGLLAVNNLQLPLVTLIEAYRSKYTPEFKAKVAR